MTSGDKNPSPLDGLSPDSPPAAAWCFFVAVFLNAFVDLGHKITIQNTLFKLYSGSYQVIMTVVEEK